MLMQVIGNPLFERWAKMMGEEHWLTDPRFKDDLGRGENSEEISERMAAWCSERTVSEAIGACEAVRIPCGPVYSPQQTIDDPHVQAMDFLKPLEYPGFDGAALVANTPVNMSVSQVGIRHRAPLLGEHTEDIMTELGLSADEIAVLREKRVV